VLYAVTFEGVRIGSAESRPRSRSARDGLPAWRTAIARYREQREGEAYTNGLPF